MKLLKRQLWALAAGTALLHSRTHWQGQAQEVCTHTLRMLLFPTFLLDSLYDIKHFLKFEKHKSSEMNTFASSFQNNHFVNSV